MCIRDRSGEGRITSTLLKQNILTYDDTFLVYLEANGDENKGLGSTTTSITYRYPLGNFYSLTTAIGYSNRKLIELPQPARDVETDQLQGLIQFDWMMDESLEGNVNAFAGISINDSETKFKGKLLPPIVPKIIRNPRTGFFKFGFSSSRQWERVSGSATLYGLSLIHI